MTKRNLAVLPAILIILGLTLISCGKKSVARDYWPTEAWRRATPESVGFDSAKLLAAMKAHDFNAMGLHSLLIIKNGSIVFEAYRYPYSAEVPHTVNSVTKSVTSTVFGIARDKGLVKGVNQKVLSYFPEYLENEQDERKRNITVQDVLTMRTGQNWIENASLEIESSFGTMIESDNWLKSFLDTPMMMKSGVAFEYNTGASHVLSAIIDRTTGNAEGFAQENLFKPIGITEHYWKKDPQGIPAGGYGLALTSENMARFGYLLLNKGKWDGTQIVSGRWIREATKKHTTTQGDMNKAWSYGYQWWLPPAGDFFAAQGFGGQNIFVIPKNDMVIVTTAHLDYRRLAEFQGFILRDLFTAFVSKDPIAENETAARELQDYCADWSRPPAPQNISLPRALTRSGGLTIAFDKNDQNLVGAKLAYAEETGLRLEYEYRDQDGSPLVVTLLAGCDMRYRIINTRFPETSYQFDDSESLLASKVLGVEDSTVIFETLPLGVTTGPFIDRITIEGDRVSILHFNRSTQESYTVTGRVVGR